MTNHERSLSPETSLDRPASLKLNSFDSQTVFSDLAMFSGVSPDQLETLNSAAEPKTFSKNQLIAADLDQLKSLCVIVSGTVAITSQADYSKRAIVGLKHEHDLLGLSSLVVGEHNQGPAATNPHRLHLAVTALTTTKLVCVPLANVQNLLETNPSILWRANAVLSNELRQTREALADFTFLDVTGRTAKKLLEFAAGSDSFTLPITQEELATVVGASRERVNKALTSLVRLGWLEQQERRYTISDRTQLELRASP